MSTLPKCFLCHPTVCAVENDYIIAVPVRVPVFMKIQIGEHTYYNAANGVRLSDTRVQLFRVDKPVLDAAGHYTVIYQPVYLRLPFYCAKGTEQTRTYAFRPLREQGDIHICHISDTHGRRKPAAQAGAFFGGDLDLLLLNGDIQDFSGTIDQILLPYQIASDITGGEIPVIISRGNHDLRGTAAQQLHRLWPTANGKTYYPVRLGRLWFLVMDCGEDKRDSHPEYSGSVACEPFRREETDFLEAVTDPAVFHPEEIRRFVVAHMPFSIRNTEPCKGEEAPFDIENERYDHWCRLLNERVKPELFFGGHYHELTVLPNESPRNTRGLDCPILIGGRPGAREAYACTQLVLHEKSATVYFVDQNRQILQRQMIPLSSVE